MIIKSSIKLTKCTKTFWSMKRLEVLCKSFLLSPAIFLYTLCLYEYRTLSCAAF